MGKNRIFYTYKRLNDNSFKYNNSDFLKEFIGNRDHFFSFSGRQGLLKIIDDLEIGVNDAVLLPSFSPQGIILPFQKKKKQIKYYQLNSDLSINIKDLKDKINKFDIKLLMVIHYFGIKQDISQIRKFINRNIIILEDCAHSFIGYNQSGSKIGGQGDITMFSFTKYLPVADGALFIYNNNQSYQKTYQKTKFIFFRTFAFYASKYSLILKTLMYRLEITNFRFLIDFLSKVLYFFYYQIICISNSYWPISKSSLNKLNQFDIDSISKKRVENREVLISTLNNTSYKYYKLKEYYPHLGFPLFIKNRVKLLKYLKGENIEVLIYHKKWYYFGAEIKNAYFDKFNFIETHFLVPILERYSHTEIVRLAEILNRYEDFN